MADLDLDGVRERLTFAEAIRLVDDKPEHPVYESQGDVAPLLAEIARLRAIADPLERLEAWHRADAENRHAEIARRNCAVIRLEGEVLRLNAVYHPLGWLEEWRSEEPSTRGFQIESMGQVNCKLQMLWVADGLNMSLVAYGPSILDAINVAMGIWDESHPKEGV